MSDFGKKGGTSPTKGKTVNVYAFEYPDGRVGAKKTFKFDGMPASAYIYQYEGKWFVAAIAAPNDEALSHYQQVPAQRGEVED